MEENARDSINKRESLITREKLIQWVAGLLIALLLQSFFTLWIKGGTVRIFGVASTDGYMLNTVAAVGILWILKKLEKELLVRGGGFWETALQLILSGILAGFSIVGVYYEGQKEIYVAFGDLFRYLANGIYLVIAFCGGVLFFYLVFRLLRSLVGRFPQGKEPDQNSFFGKHLYRNCILLMCLCWLPLYIIRFPGILHYDSWRSISMHLGYTEYTSIHPLIWGVPISLLTKAGMSIGINWLAALVLCILQHVLIMMVVPYTISNLKQFGVGTGYLAGVLGYFILNPFISTYTTVVYNDNLYAYAMLLLSVELLNYLFNREQFFESRRHRLLTGLGVFGTIFRYNGYYIMLILISVLVLRECWLLLKRKNNLKKIIIIVMITVIPLTTGQLIQNTLNRSYKVETVSTRAMLAMPIQHAARCLGEFGTDIPKEDYEALHTVMTWTDEKYAEEFDPDSFDDVKHSFKTDATKAEVIGFLKAWINLLVRYPGECLLTTMKQTYYLFSPLSENARFYRSLTYTMANLESATPGIEPMELAMSVPILETLAALVYNFYNKIFPALPFLGLLSSQAVYTILLLGICLCLLFRKDKRALLIALPLLITLGITFIGPMVLNHSRYSFPLIYCMPVLLAAFLKEKADQPEEKKVD